MSRLVAVSNRVTPPRRASAAGGLAVGIQSAMRDHGGVWFGWGGELTDGDPSRVTVSTRHGIEYACIDLRAEDYDGYYLGFSNGTLWPLFHYFLDNFHYSEAHFDAYSRVNRQFARQLLPRLRPDDVVWVHDYHLIPLAAALREGGFHGRIGFFLHIPFPSIEVLRALPTHRELLASMLAYDLIGFQTDGDEGAFRGAIRHVLGAAAIATPGVVRASSRKTRTGTFPIGVDVAQIQREADEAGRTDAARRMEAGLLGRRLLIGVDRLDYSKGLIERVRAYERMLERRPAYLNQVTFLQIAPLSRTDLAAYAGIRRELEQTAGRINGRFADTDWTPIRYLNRNFSHDLLMSFLRTAQVGVVTPVRDGMNLVAKEFIAAQHADDPGVLVLSTMAGAAREMDGALLVNPYDIGGMADAMERALTMPLGERQARHASMLDTLRRHDIHAWRQRFLEDLTAARTTPGAVAGSLQRGA